MQKTIVEMTIVQWCKQNQPNIVVTLKQQHNKIKAQARLLSAEFHICKCFYIACQILGTIPITKTKPWRFYIGSTMIRTTYFSEVN